MKKCIIHLFIILSYFFIYCKFFTFFDSVRYLLSVHDFKYCKCGACSIDGGNEYTRVGGDFDYIHWVYDDGHEEKINVKNNK